MSATSTRAAAVIGWLAANPGYHAPCDIAAATGYTTHQVAATLLRLTREGRLLRKRKHPNGVGASVYAAPTQTV